MLTIDHLMWTVPDLQQGCDQFAQMTGVAPRPGGSHTGRGTCNALVSLRSQQYLEILAPDPQQELAGTQGQALSQLTAPVLATYCVRGLPLPEIAERAAQLGLQASDPVPFERITPQGEALRWQLLFLSGHGFAGLLPFFIDWQESRHPALTARSDFAIESVQLETATPQSLQRLVDGLQLPVSVEQGSDHRLSAVLVNAQQRVSL